MDDFERELKLGFLDEAAAALEDVEQSFLILETQPNDSGVIDKIFRLAHNLKGSSRAVGFEDMGAFTHEFESLLLKIKNQELLAVPAIVNLLLRCTDHLVQWIASLRGDLNATVDSGDLIAELIHAKEAREVAPSISVEGSIAEVQSESKTDQVKGNEEEGLDNDQLSEDDLHILREAFGDQAVDSFPNIPETAVLSVKPQQLDKLKIAEDQDRELESLPSSSSLKSVSKADSDRKNSQTGASGVTASSTNVAGDENIRVSIKKLERLLNYVGELTILQSVLNEQVIESGSVALKKTAHQLGKVGKEIQDISMGLRMVPIRPTFQKMQRIVRDTAQALGKDVQLVLVGEDTELDKTVLEKINDPLVHLVRNSVDHGIENKEQRQISGKSSQGIVTLSAFHQSGRLIIQVKDDGGGIHPEKIKKKAIEKGIIKTNANLSEKEILNLVFAPSFSTKEAVTEISGRGVGMDVVKTNIEELQGDISIESVVGQGSVFTISLPLTLAIIEGMIVRCGPEKYVIPINHIHESLRPNLKDIQTTSHLGEILMLRGENLPTFKMAQLFGNKTDSKSNEMIAIVVRSNGIAYTLLVDDIVGKSQVVIKQLGPELHHLRGVSGSTILGDGKPAFIVEPNDLVSSKLKIGKTDTRRAL